VGLFALAIAPNDLFVLVGVQFVDGLHSSLVIHRSWRCRAAKIPPHRASPVSKSMILEISDDRVGAEAAANTQVRDGGKKR